MSARIILESFDATVTSLPGDLAGYLEESWNRGSPRLRRGAHELSGHSLALSGAGLDATEKQIEDVLAFLTRHADSLRRYLEELSSPRAEVILTTCIPPSTAAAQEVTFPPDLLAVTGRLGLSLSLRTLLTDDSPA